MKSWEVAVVEGQGFGVEEHQGVAGDDEVVGGGGVDVKTRGWSELEFVGAVGESSNDLTRGWIWLPLVSDFVGSFVTYRPMDLFFSNFL